MKKTIRISIKVKKCDTVFKEGMEAGVLGFTDFTYDLDPEEYERPMFAVALLEEGEKIQKEVIEISAKEIKDEEVQEGNQGKD